MKDEEKRKLEGWEIEKTKKCPICNSKEISKFETYQVWKEKDLKTKRILGKSRITPVSLIFVSYNCRNCGWDSITFDE